MKNEERTFTIFLLVVMLAMTFLSLGFSSGSRMLPMIAGIASLVLLAFLMLMSLSPGVASWYSKLEQHALVKSEKMNLEEKKREIGIVVWFLGCLILIYLIGFLIAMPLFLFLFLKWRAGESWVLSIVVPAAVTAVVYFAFIFILRVPLHAGIFFE